MVGFVTTGVMASRNESKDSLDFFPTPLWATRALCEYLKQHFDLKNKTVWEPACGKGHMSAALHEYFEIVGSTDIFNYGFGSTIDFLNYKSDYVFDWIITNPPFNLAQEFIFKALPQVNMGCAFLVRTSFVEGSKRYKNLFADNRPNIILQFTERLSMYKNRVDPNGSGATAYCWMIFLKQKTNQTIFDWIPPCRDKLERPNDYMER